MDKNGFMCVVSNRRKEDLKSQWTFPRKTFLQKNAPIPQCIYIRTVTQSTVAKSICTHYSNLSGRPDIFLGSETLKKKLGPKYGVQKAGCKKQGHCYSKREEAAAFFSFLNNNDPVFCTLLFASHIFDLIFFRVTNRPMFSKQE